MTDEVKSFRKGDWVSHLQYGVGQVEGKEKKTLGGESQEYYKVQTRNGVYWIPIDNLDPDRIRPVVSEKKLQKAIGILESPPQVMDSKHTVRKKRIDEVTEEGAVDSINQLSELYMGQPFFGGLRPAEAVNLETRVIYKIKPTKVVTASG